MLSYLPPCTCDVPVMRLAHQVLGYGGLILFVVVGGNRLIGPLCSCQLQVSLLTHVRVDAEGVSGAVKAKQRLLGDSSTGWLAPGEHGVSITVAVSQSSPLALTKKPLTLD